ncbi:pyruvate dehydrogenase E1 component beta subunit [Roseivivax lentus]|uniref:Pyruvate dehydrogenase E1 component beta subunit n=1 Tax=Roseivivax lentus TaxID=633194 RepID=A0A1N7L4G4_9RHOB|nr:pyruvate dehydrogenase complex E1 component subunit beta [Roseivivax lentus]SIS68728.1 pyruvate dehydrogenase E1 component beta subunit [Roseivivax lentus]
MTRWIPMPEVSPGLEVATLRQWMVRPGDLVEEGDLLAEIETEKATLEIEAPEAGRIAELLVGNGTAGVAVGSAIARLADEQTDVEAPAARPQPVAPTRDPAPMRSPARAVDPDWPEGVRTVQTTLRDALRDALAEEMARDDSVFLIGEDMGAAEGGYSVTQGLIERFGGTRVVAAPPLWQGGAGLAVGAAMAGLRPVVAFRNLAFALQAASQIVQSAAKTAAMTGGALSVPVVFRGPHGAVGQMGGQLSHDMAAWAAQIPGLKVAAPYGAADAKGLLKTAIRDAGPVIFLENDALYGQPFAVPEGVDHLVPFGRARRWRAGGDVTLVSYGAGMSATLEAADLLAAEGVAADVIDLRSLAPLDTDALTASLRETHRCVVVDHGWPRGGIGQQVSAVLMREAFDMLDAPVTCLAAADVARPYADGLEAAALPDAAEVVAAARAVLYR